MLGLSDGSRKVLEIGKGAEFAPTASPIPAEDEHTAESKKEKACTPNPINYYAREAGSSMVVASGYIAESLATCVPSNAIEA